MKNAILITGGAKRLGSLIAQELSKEDTILLFLITSSVIPLEFRNVLPCFVVFSS